MRIKLSLTLLLILIIISSVQSTQKPIKKVIVIGHTGSGKSTLSGYLTKSKQFKIGSGASSVTQEFQTKNFVDKDYEIYVTDTPGFTDAKKQNNWQLLDQITTFIKEKKIDFVILVLNFSIREQNETYIMKWLKYTLPFEKHNSLILVNQYRKIQNMFNNSYFDNPNDKEKEDCQSTNDGQDQNNYNFMDFLKLTFNHTNIRTIEYNQNENETQNQFIQLANEIRYVQLPSAQIDHSNVISLSERISNEKQKNIDFCYTKYYEPHYQKIQSQIEEKQLKMLEIQGELKANKDIISYYQSELDNMSPEGEFETGMLWWIQQHQYHTSSQLKLVNSLNRNMSSAEISNVTEKLKYHQLGNQISKLKEEIKDLSEKIPEMKKYSDCLEAANEGVQEMIKVREYFLNININLKVQKGEL